MNDVKTLLQQLRDIHEPASISWWPLASGWYIVIVLLVVVALYAVWHILRKRRIRRIALRELDNLKTIFQKNGDKQYTASHLSILLRKVFLSQHTRYAVAGLEGEAWLTFLDHATDSTDFTQGEGRVLVSAPYALHVGDNLEALFTLVEKTIKRCV